VLFHAGNFMLLSFNFRSNHLRVIVSARLTLYVPQQCLVRLKVENVFFALAGHDNHRHFSVLLYFILFYFIFLAQQTRIYSFS
jgi:hypothetical protein